MIQNTDVNDLEILAIEYSKLVQCVNDIGEGLRANWDGESSDIMLHRARELVDDMSEVYEEIKAWIADIG